MRSRTKVLLSCVQTVLLALAFFPSISSAQQRAIGVYVSDGDEDSAPVAAALRTKIGSTMRYALSSKPSADIEIYLVCMRPTEGVLVCSTTVLSFAIETEPLYAIDYKAMAVTLGTTDEKVASLIFQNFVAGTTDEILAEVHKDLRARTALVVKRANDKLKTAQASQVQ